MKRIFTTVIIICMCLWVSIVWSKTIHVPDDHPTIQAGIDAASDGDTVLVTPGTYYERIDFKGKAIVVKSASGYNQTTIDGYKSGAVVNFVSNEDSRSVLEGFKITNGNGIFITSSPTIKNNWLVNGGGITVTPVLKIPFPIITDNIIESNGIGILAGSMGRGPTIPNIIHNIIKGNTAFGIWLVNCWSSYKQPAIFNNLIAENNIGIAISYSTFSTADPFICNNTIVNNTESGISAASGNPIIINCIMWGNGDDLEWGPSKVPVSPIVQYSDIEDGDYKGKNGNISIDPLFVTGPQGQYYLSQTDAGQAKQSPCVDSGSPSASAIGLQNMTTRIDEMPDKGQVDMGYHFSILKPASPPEDINQDGVVDILDLVLIGKHYGESPPTDARVDVNGDGTVDILDLEKIQENFMGGTNHELK